MDQQQLLNLLRQVREGSVEPEKAMLTLRMEPFEEDLGYAKIDRHRALRQGVAEVIYGAGKTPEQIEGILLRMRHGGQNRVLVTRLTPESAARLEHIDGFQYYPQPRLAVVGGLPDPDPGTGKIVVATGGTSDLPVAEEAALTAETLGNQVERMYDVGVAGLHRLLSRVDRLMEAKVVIAVAGMEGALASVVGGLVDCPVIAVPTSVGYGASLGGLSALLSMLNSCASGTSVVNIDNGFGAGFLASRINHIGAASDTEKEKEK